MDSIKFKNLKKQYHFFSGANFFKKNLLISALVFSMTIQASFAQGAVRVIINWKVSDTSLIASYTMYYSYEKNMVPKMVACATSNSNATSLICNDVPANSFPMYFQVGARTHAGDLYLTNPKKGILKIQGFMPAVYLLLLNGSRAND